MITPLITLKIQIGESQASKYQEGGMLFGLGYGLALNHSFIPKITILGNDVLTVRFVYAKESAVIFNCFGQFVLFDLKQ